MAGRYDPVTRTIILNDIVSRGGQIAIAGQILSTGHGQLKVAYGYTGVSIVNNSPFALSLGRIDVTTDRVGKITIVDSAKTNLLKTVYEMTASGVVTKTYNAQLNTTLPADGSGDVGDHRHHLHAGHDLGAAGQQLRRQQRPADLQPADRPAVRLGRGPGQDLDHDHRVREEQLQPVRRQRLRRPAVGRRRLVLARHLLHRRPAAAGVRDADDLQLQRRRLRPGLRRRAGLHDPVLPEGGQDDAGPLRQHDHPQDRRRGQRRPLQARRLLGPQRPDLGALLPADRGLHRHEPVDGRRLRDAQLRQHVRERQDHGGHVDDGRRLAAQEDHPHEDHRGRRPQGLLHAHAQGRRADHDLVRARARGTRGEHHQRRQHHPEGQLRRPDRRQRPARVDGRIGHERRRRRPLRRAGHGHRPRRPSASTSRARRWATPRPRTRSPPAAPS